MAHRWTQWLFRHRLAVVFSIFIVGVAAVGAYSLSLPQVPSNEGDRTAPVNTERPLTSVGQAGEGGNVSLASIHLSEGQAQPQAAQPAQVSTGEPLSEEEIAQVASRLPELTPEPGDQGEFHLAQQPIPPPRPGETIDIPFPPPAPEPSGPATVESGPLKVLRYSPEGEIPIAPFISVTFNQPMVPLGTLPLVMPDHSAVAPVAALPHRAGQLNGLAVVDGVAAAT
ncbi:MAG: hypothetical protein M1281_14585, partial [Chloroflexi bacterium]|nr:hypothetical protein [Chloroflexota bacterium]